MPVVGFLGSETLTDMPQDRVTAFRQGLKEAGFVEDQNVAIEYRWDEGQTDRLPLLVQDLLRRRVALIVSFSTTAALAAKAATNDSAGRLCVRGRPRPAWPRRQPQPAGWQRHRRQLHLRGTWGEAAWALA